MSVIARASSGPLACEIRKASIGDAVQLTGVVSSSVALSGQVRFVLTKSGPSGNSNVSQGNAFDLAAGAEDHVSHVTINLGQQDRAMLEFVATSKDGVTCRATATFEF
ncbi:curli-like amyloid fiber formation chaperone CsgH [Bradyrhizobium sp.]|uniref:curli-like amyloid fiber formation chaperone CsgH n=1 Tax=Bradyrhizobium sp. TaxID=376 RepID=UPI0039E362D5